MKRVGSKPSPGSPLLAAFTRPALCCVVTLPVHVTPTLPPLYVTARLMPSPVQWGGACFHWRLQGSLNKVGDFMILVVNFRHILW